MTKTRTRYVAQAITAAAVLVGFALLPVPPAQAAPTQSDTLTIRGIPVSATEGTAFNGVVTATFTDSNPSATASSFTPTLTIDWGDGNVTGGTVSGPTGGPFTVSGSNTYVDDGTFTVTTEISSSTSNGGTTSTATVADADSSTGLNNTSITATEGTQFSGVVGTYQTSYQGQLSSDIAVSIDWGDATTPSKGAAEFTGKSGGFANFNISGHHTYADEGTFTAQVTAGEDFVNGISLTTPDTVTVGEADGGTVTPVTFSATEGTVFNGAVLTFTGSTANSPSDFATPTIDWGDGTPATTGTVANPSPGTFTVNGTHTYIEEGTYTTTVSTADDSPGTASISGTGQANVADAPITSAGGLILTGVEGATTSGTVAQFFDVIPNAAPGDYAAAIDWGDGSPLDLSGLIQFTGSSVGFAHFTVSGNHVYNEQGSFIITTLICDTDQGTVGWTGTCPTGRSSTSTSSGPSSVTVTDAALTPFPQSFDPTEGTSFTGIAGVFDDADGSRDGGGVADYSATIDWGDNTTSTGNVSPCVPADGCGLGTVKVVGTHTYADEGSYPVTVTANDDGGATTTITSTATVLEGDVGVLVPSSISAVEGTAFSGQVGAFVDSYANTAADFTATIDWGDGSTTPGTVTSPSAGHFTVSGTHTYADECSCTTAVHLADDAPGTASVTAHGTANVADVTLSPTATTTPTEAAGFPFTTTVANFSDANPLATSTDFSATIDWGDGTTSSGTASGPTGGPFSISGSHTYAAPGSYAVAVTITDGTQQVVAHSTINVPLTCPPGANVLSGSLAGTIIIGPNSNTCLKGATTSGGVIVQRGATATIVNSSIGGSVSSSGAATFAMCNTSTVGGVSVSGTTGDTTVGDDTELCNGNTIHSSLILSSDTGGLEAFANAVSGSGTMISDTGAATPAEDTIPEIEQNGFGGGLSCSGITPAPTNDGVANTAPSKGGQCAGL